MRRVWLCLWIVVMLSALSAGSVGAQASATTTVEQVPMQQMVDIPCAGEQVLLEGTLLIVTHWTYSGNEPPNFTFRSLHNPQGVKGYGLVSGANYQGVGVTQTTISSNVADDGWPYEDTYVSNFRIIGPGPGNNYLVHYLVHRTVDNNAVLRSNVYNLSVECK